MQNIKSPSPSDTAVAATTKQRLILFIVALTVIALDQLTKRLVESNLGLYEVWEPIPAIAPFFRILHATNTGAAFGFLPQAAPVFATMALIVSCGIMYYNHTLPAGQTVMRIALGCTLGGALGNVIDRFRLGHVTDFLDFGPWPIFNVADTAVVTGAIILGWLMFREIQEEKRLSQQTAVGKRPNER